MTEQIGVLIIGVKGAVSTTLIAAGIASSQGELSHFPLPSEVDPLLSRVDLPPLSAMRFGGWDVASASLVDSLRHHQVIPSDRVDGLETPLSEVQLFSGITLNPAPIHGDLDRSIVRAKDVDRLRDLVDKVRDDIKKFRQREGLERVIVLDLSSTAPSLQSSHYHQTVAEFNQLLDLPVAESLSAEVVHEGMLYAYAAISEGCPCINFTPSVTFDVPAMINLAESRGVPLCGKDGKTGQTLYKTAIAPLLQQRALKVRGWYSTNILGNRDGEVLDHPEHRKTKIDSKTAVLADILGYEDFDHQVHIHYYKPRGDAKEAWDNIDFEGWFGVPMQLKINWLGSDSILAAPLAADLIRWMVFYHQQNMSGIIGPLSSYFKSPLESETHDFFAQVHTLREDIQRRLDESL